MQRLQGALASTFLECNDLNADTSRGITEFRPHLSVANVGVSADQVEQRKENLGKKWRPLSFRVDEVYIISRDGFDDPFSTRFRVPLGGGFQGPAAAALPGSAVIEPPHKAMNDLQEPYVASVGSYPAFPGAQARDIPIFSSSFVFSCVSLEP